MSECMGVRDGEGVEIELHLHLSIAQLLFMFLKSASTHSLNVKLRVSYFLDSR